MPGKKTWLMDLLTAPEKRLLVMTRENVFMLRNNTSHHSVDFLWARQCSECFTWVATFILTAAPWDSCYYFPLFTNGEPEARRDQSPTGEEVGLQTWQSGTTDHFLSHFAHGPPNIHDLMHLRPLEQFKCFISKIFCFSDVFECPNGWNFAAFVAFS